LSAGIYGKINSNFRIIVASGVRKRDPREVQRSFNWSFILFNK
jgi:hypothetical protein